MDSDASIRRRFKKKAKRLSKRGKSKKESDSSSSGSTDSSSSMDVQEDAITGLFAEQTAVQRMWHRFPGVLTAQLLQDIQRTMLLQLGSMNASPDQLTPIVSQYVRQHLSTMMSPVVFREAAHWGACLDCMIQGRTAAVVDIMSQRLKALESLSKGMAVGLIKQLELIQVDGPGLASSSELQQAGRSAYEEQKVMAKATGKTYEARDKGKSKEKGKGDREGKDKDREKGKKDKGDNKKKG